MSRARVLAAVLLVGLAAAGCGGDGGELASGDGADGRPRLGVGGGDEGTAAALGVPSIATKNTTRIAGGDATADAAAVARAVFPAATPGTRPEAVVLADAGDWRVATAAAVLMAAPTRAPVLLTDGDEVPRATADALEALAPRGARALGGAQVVRVGAAPAPGGLRDRAVEGDDPFALAAALDRLSATVRGRVSDDVVVVSADEPAFGMPAAAWAAKAGDPVLFVRRDEVPAATRAALRRHDRPRIRILGPPAAVSGETLRALRRYGTVERIHGPDPVRNAIAFARFDDGAFGWGVVDPGHGVVFANADQPLTAAAAAPLSASGTYGPLLVVDRGDALPRPVEDFLLDIQPGYRGDPVRGVYNHGWLIGDARALSEPVQARIDALLEIAPVDPQDPSQ